MRKVYNIIIILMLIFLSPQQYDLQTDSLLPISVFSSHSSEAFDSTPPHNITMERGESVILSWSITTTAKTGENYHYKLYDNESLVDSSGIAGSNGKNINWDLTLDVEAPGYPEVGLHKILLWMNYTDSNNNWQNTTDQVWVDVHPLTSPILLSQPMSETTYQEDTTGNYLNWTAEDLNPNNYSIFVNNTLDGSYNSLSWVSGEEISYNIDGLPINTTSNFTIVLEDIFGLQTEDTVSVTVVENIAPIFVDTPKTVYYQFGTTDNFLNWTVSDEDLSHYEIYKDNQYQSTTSIGNDGTIMVNIDGLSIGTYIYKIIVFDDFGNNQSDEVEVNVVETSNPIILSSPNDISYIYGEIGNQLSYEVYDETPDIYLLYRNGTSLLQGEWSSDQPFAINVDGYGVGTHNVTVVFYDEFNNKVSDLVYITVFPISTTKPELALTSIIMTGALETISGTWNCEDTCNFVQSSVNVQLRNTNNGIVREDNFQIASNGSYTIEFDYSNVIPDDYQWQITFTGIGLETQQLTYDITVTPLPITLDIEYTSTLVRGEAFSIIVQSIIQNETSTRLGLNKIVNPAGYFSNLNVTLTFSYTDKDGELLKWQDSQFTNSTGFTIFTIDASITSKIEEISSIDVVGLSDFSSPVSQLINDNSQLPTLSGSISNDNDENNNSISTELLKEFLRNPIYIAGYIFLAFIVAMGILVLRGPKQDEFVNYEQLKSLRTVILYNKDGIPMFSANLGNFSTSTALIAGLSSAMTNFLDEMSESEQEEFYTMEKSDLFILSHKLKESIFAVISSTPYSKTFKSNFAKAHIQIYEELPRTSFIDPYSIDNDLISLKTLNILSENDIQIKILYPFSIKFNELKETKKGNLPKVVQTHFKSLMRLKDIQQPNNIEYWSDRLTELELPRSEIIDLIITLSEQNFLAVTPQSLMIFQD